MINEIGLIGYEFVACSYKINGLPVLRLLGKSILYENLKELSKIQTEFYNNEPAQLHKIINGVTTNALNSIGDASHMGYFCVFQYLDSVAIALFNENNSCLKSWDILDFRIIEKELVVKYIMEFD